MYLQPRTGNQLSGGGWGGGKGGGERRTLMVPQRKDRMPVARTAVARSRTCRSSAHGSLVSPETRSCSLAFEKIVDGVFLWFHAAVKSP